ncbi:glycosyltransferase N-terminal domain-containing protein [uncultured Microscilla sp.]|uniref:3-deoxy-D-manno-octulosonic acid transferase n=1 Tax=uncultured Microscilla sp. TaxID=432653 RepID=UPI002602F794|nr:glycosyltransferase N-terminal domain-containing protein [uncultured Microscilla sp.]
MLFLYNLGIRFYSFAVWVASFFNPKAKLWLEGRKKLFARLNTAFQGNTDPVIWFHTSSLGEFEQGRPVIEHIKANHPELKVLITFFSPSGYEIRHDYDQADYVFYLPLDTRRNAQKFLSIVRPQAVFFVKYEFWYHFLNETQKTNVPMLLFSSIFRKQQFFFKSYGRFFRKVLRNYTHIFVQNQASVDLLQSIQVQNVSIAGDTRFDRVKAIADQQEQFPIVETFVNAQLTLVVGSSWWRDLVVLIPFLNDFGAPIKTIIAPHEINDQEIERLQDTLNKKSVRYTHFQDQPLDDEAVQQALRESDVLILDTIGMLAGLYQYADFAYIGGAFGEGLHNTLEPAVFDTPVLFGKEYDKYQEAVDMVNLGGAFSINNAEELSQVMNDLYFDEEKRAKAAKVCTEYVLANLGSSDKIYRYFIEKIYKK